MPKRPRGQPRGDQRWSTFVRNHAASIMACDFCVVVTATFRLLYVLAVIEHQTRRIVHCSVTSHPTAAWTLQQLREAIASDHGYRFLIHDRDGIFSPQLDQSVRRLRLRVLRTPPRSPKTNSICERVIGTLRRECLDFLIPLTENHLHIVTKKTGSRITIEADPTPALGRASRIRQSVFLSHKTNIGIAFQATLKL